MIETKKIVPGYLNRAFTVDTVDGGSYSMWPQTCQLVRGQRHTLDSESELSAKKHKRPNRKASSLTLEEVRVMLTTDWDGTRDRTEKDYLNFPEFVQDSCLSKFFTLAAFRSVQTSESVFQPYPSFQNIIVDR